MSGESPSPSIATKARPSASLSARILVVEDDEALRLAIVTALRDSWSEVHEAIDGAAAIAVLSDDASPCYDVVVTDLRLPGANGVEVLRAALGRNPQPSVILMTAYASVENAVEAMQLGAVDFIQKPFELHELELRVRRAVEHRSLVGEVMELRREGVLGVKDGDFVAESDSMKEAVALAEQVAGIASTVLVTGETGTGKEVIAGLIHARSRRCRAAFVKVNCAALPETLLESELFGHERGAFTGAESLRLGRFEEADGGTLLLDEIAETSPATQAKLLRVLQDQEFYRLGGSQPRRTDARIIAATNRDLRRAVSRGEFREDLYFRLNVIEIHLAPLRERPEDLLALSHRFFAQFSRELGQSLEAFSEPALSRIMAHDWPGNVRELRNAIERAVLMATGSRVEVADLAIEDGPTLSLGTGERLDLPVEGLLLSDVEREVVLAALRRVGFVQKDAADLLGVSRRKLNYMVQRMGITHPSWRRNRGSIFQPDDEKN